jgi:hypothetical protein
MTLLGIGWGGPSEAGEPFVGSKDELFEEHPDLVPAWQVFRDARANRRAVDWLLGQRLIRDDGPQVLGRPPDPDLP